MTKPSESRAKFTWPKSLTKPNPLQSMHAFISCLLSQALTQIPCLAFLGWLQFLTCSFGVCPSWPWFRVGSLCHVLVWAEVTFLLRWRWSLCFASGSLPCHVSLVQGKINRSNFLWRWHPKGLGAAAIPALRIYMNYFIWTSPLEGRSLLSQE